MNLHKIIPAVFYFILVSSTYLNAQVEEWNTVLDTDEPLHQLPQKKVPGSNTSEVSQPSKNTLNTTRGDNVEDELKTKLDKLKKTITQREKYYAKFETLCENAVPDVFNARVKKQKVAWLKAAESIMDKHAEDSELIKKITENVNSISVIHPKFEQYVISAEKYKSAICQGATEHNPDKNKYERMALRMDNINSQATLLYEEWYKQDRVLYQQFSTANLDRDQSIFDGKIQEKILKPAMEECLKPKLSYDKIVNASGYDPSLVGKAISELSKQIGRTRVNYQREDLANKYEKKFNERHTKGKFTFKKVKTVLKLGDYIGNKKKTVGFVRLYDCKDIEKGAEEICGHPTTKEIKWSKTTLKYLVNPRLADKPAMDKKQFQKLMRKVRGEVREKYKEKALSWMDAIVGTTAKTAKENFINVRNKHFHQIFFDNVNSSKHHIWSFNHTLLYGLPAKDIDSKSSLKLRTRIETVSSPDRKSFLSDASNYYSKGYKQALIQIGSSDQALINWSLSKHSVNWRRGLHQVYLELDTSGYKGKKSTKSYAIAVANKIDIILEQQGFYDFPLVPKLR